MRNLLILVALGVFGQPLLAQSIWPTQVVDHQFGSNQTFGQSPETFPENVLGPVAAVASTEAPASAPEDIVSLGRDGYITFGFDAPIRDWPGPDFTVFENAFYYGNGFVFDEWLKVEVSADGQNFVAFAHDTLTGEGLAGRTPTSPQAAGTNTPTQAGGDAYDLADIGLDTVRYIRLTDMTRHQPADRLAAEVDGIRVWRPSTVSRDERLPTTRLLKTALGYRIKTDDWIRGYVLMDATGRTLVSTTCHSQSETITMEGLATGVYVLRLHTTSGVVTHRLVQ